MGSLCAILSVPARPSIIVSSPDTSHHNLPSVAHFYPHYAVSCTAKINNTVSDLLSIASCRHRVISRA